MSSTAVTYDPAGGRAGARRTVLGLLAIVALGAAMALIEQHSSPTAASHFALIRSLATGTAEIGPNESIDTSYMNGRYYSNKAPGLAFAMLPPYLALRTLGLQDGQLESFDLHVPPLWQLTLFGGMLPAVLLAMLVLVAVERITPGYGGLTAILLGAGTLLLPFGTMLFGHVLSATLGFAAFVVLMVERQRGFTAWRAGLAGLLAGLAVVVEYPLGIVVVVLAAYVASGSQVARRLGSYAAGAAIGVAPLLAYNTWAFDSPTTLSYSNVVTAPPGAGPPTLGSGNAAGFYGVAIPDLRVAATLLFSEKGLFVVAPLCAVALLGFPSLWRSHRAEAAVCAVVPALFLAYNASYYIPFGGQGPGPRFLVPALPFLALPLGVALARRLLPVLIVGVASIVVMAVATATDPLTTEEQSLGDWFDRLLHGKPVFSPLWSDRWPGLIPSALLLVTAVVLGIASAAPSREALRWITLAMLVLPTWLVTAIAVPQLLPANPDHGTVAGTLAAVALLSAVVIGLARADRRGLWIAVALIPLVFLVVPEVSTRQRVALLVALVSLGAVCVAALRPGRPPAEGPPGEAA